MTEAFLFVLGLIVGSFLNVVGLRYRSGRGVGGRSECPHCGKSLKWWELVPIVSFLALRGRCSACRSRISWQYPAVELFTGLIFATLSFVYWPAFCFYIVILIYDLRHKIIPDSLVYASVVYAVVVRFFFLPSSALDWLAGPALLAVFALGWYLSKGRALGFGDGKLALSLGLLLGAAQGLSAVVMAFWIGALITGSLVLYGKKSLTMKSEVPFAPFLILGAWVALFYHLDLFHI